MHWTSSKVIQKFCYKDIFRNKTIKPVGKNLRKKYFQAIGDKNKL